MRDSTFTVIEGNKENKVTRRTIPIGWGYIRGLAAPKYEEEKTPKKSVDDVVREVLNGLWGNGTDRRNRLTKEGYNYKEVQQRVNELVKGEYVTVNPGDTFSKIAKSHSTSVAEILKLNSALIKNQDSIHVGWKIRVK